MVSTKYETAQRRSARDRKCPRCNRLAAISKHADFESLRRWCRWCDYEDITMFRARRLSDFEFEVLNKQMARDGWQPTMRAGFFVRGPERT